MAGGEGGREKKKGQKGQRRERWQETEREEVTPHGERVGISEKVEGQMKGGMLRY